MGDDLEKMTNNLLDGEKGTIPTTIKGLAMALDQYLARQEEANRERHDEVINTIAGIKITVNKDCDTCRKNYDGKFTEVDKKFEKLKYILFFSENPKSAVIMLMGVFAILFMGVENIFSKLSNLIK